MRSSFAGCCCGGGALISVAAHGLRDRVIQWIFVAGMNLQSAASQTVQPAVRQRVEAAAGDLDQALRLIRDTVFGLEHRLRDRGLRQEILELSGGLSPAPEVSFTGPVDGSLRPGGQTRSPLLREALAVIGQDAAVASIGVTTDEAACVTVIETTLLPHPASWAARESGGLREQAARAGASVDIDRSRAVSGWPGVCRCSRRVPPGRVRPGSRLVPVAGPGGVEGPS
jgi:hypothetical protein